MRRARATWTTKETCKMYELQENNYEEVRIKMYGKVFMTFHSQTAHKDAKAMWNVIKKVNG